MSFSIEKIAELMAFHEAAKTDSFIDFLKKVSTLFPSPPPPPPSWSGVVGGSGAPPLLLTNSGGCSEDSNSVHSDEEKSITLHSRKVLDYELNHVMTSLPFAKNSATWILLRNLYLTSPELFSRLSDAHFSGGDMHPHISIGVSVPIYHTKTGKFVKSWDSILHIYYTGEGKAKKFTDITTSFDGEIRLIATCVNR